MLERTIPSFISIVLFACITGIAGAQEPGTALRASDPLPAYSTALAVESMAVAIKAPDSPMLVQAGAKAGAFTRFGLRVPFHALSGAGIRYATQSAFSPLGVAYRPFLSAWLEAGIGMSSPTGRFGAELSASLHSGGTPETYAAQGMAGLSLTLCLRGPFAPLPAPVPRALSAPRYAAELCLPLGFLRRSDALSFQAGLGLRVWRDPLPIGGDR